MYKSIINEDFFKNLTPSLKKQCIDLCKCKKNKDMYNKISLFILLITGGFFIMAFKPILFTNKSSLSINNIFYYAKCLVFILGGFLISNSINKNSSKKYDITYKALKNALLLNICTCKTNCECKKSLKNFFKKQGIFL